MPLKILAVDDSPSIAQSMRFIFTSPRYQVASAENATDALLSVDSTQYDVVITDSKMPHFSGIEFVQELRKRSFTGKIIVLSAHLSEQTRAAFEELKVDLLIEKPFSIGPLREALLSIGV